MDMPGKSPPKESVVPSDRTARRFLLGLLVAAALAVVLVIRPIATALFVATALAGILWPLQQRLSRRLRGRRSVAAGLLVSCVIVLIVGPIATMSALVVKEVAEGVTYVVRTVRSEGAAAVLDELPAPVANIVRQGIERLPHDPGASIDKNVEKQVSAQGGKVAAGLGSAVLAMGSLVFDGAMMVVALFFLLVQGADLVRWLDRTLPMKPGETEELLEELRMVARAVFVSSVATSAIQAAVALAGYLIARVPYPIFFASITFFLAFIPAVGAAAVCLAAALLVLLGGHPYLALFLTIWGIVVVGLVDNVVKPFLAKDGMKMDGAVVFFALIGGLGAFGSVGLLLGPVVVSAFLVTTRMYRRDFVAGRHGEGQPPAKVAAAP